MAELDTHTRGRGRQEHLSAGRHAGIDACDTRESDSRETFDTACQPMLEKLLKQVDRGRLPEDKYPYRSVVDGSVSLLIRLSCLVPLSPLIPAPLKFTKPYA